MKSAGIAALRLYLPVRRPLASGKNGNSPSPYSCAAGSRSFSISRTTRLYSSWQETKRLTFIARATSIGRFSTRPSTRAGVMAPDQARPNTASGTRIYHFRAVSDWGAGAYVTDSITAPVPNPWNRRVRFGGMDFFSDGKRAALCTHEGDVWIVEGIDDTLANLKWRRFASGWWRRECDW